MKKRTIRSLIACGIVLIGIQFLGPVGTNPPVVMSHTIHSQLPIPPRIADMMDRACMDCHSHETHWPWYSRVAPMRWWLVQHVNEARETLNFSEWTKYRPSYASATLGAMGLAVEHGLMPLDSYRTLHSSARLSDEETKEFSDWAQAERLRIRNGFLAGNKTNEGIGDSTTTRAQ